MRAEQTNNTCAGSSPREVIDLGLEPRGQKTLKNIDAPQSLDLAYDGCGTRTSGKPTVFPFLPPRETLVSRPLPNPSPFAKFAKLILLRDLDSNQDFRVPSAAGLPLHHPAKINISEILKAR